MHTMTLLDDKQKHMVFKLLFGVFCQHNGPDCALNVITGTKAYSEIPVIFKRFLWRCETEVNVLMTWFYFQNKIIKPP